MASLRTPPHSVREIEHAWIPMRDGARLAARIWLPEGAGPVPAILEYLPYGKRWGTRDRDETLHPWFAARGYAAVRVDVRGAGESDGVLFDEYLPQEQEDGADVVAWIAAQPWSDGSVGMIGKSWGGFNALQVAARRPPALKAVISACASDDRYADDAHWMGGCLLVENLLWGSLLFTIAARPPDPALVGDSWRATWLARLASLPLYPEVWMRHPRRDAYWKQGSVREDYGAIACPVFAVGGWADGYSNAVPRLLAGLRAPRRGWIGPWAHDYPHEAPHGAGFLDACARWWDRWLKGRDAGPEPFFRAWSSGRWVVEDQWPSPRIEILAIPLSSMRGPARATVDTPQTVGACAGSWSGIGDAPRDQAEDDARSVVYDTEPLAERLEILGAPKVSLHASAPGRLVVRLCDVSPDGASTRVSYGVLAFDGAPVKVRLNDAAHSFAPGHRIRLALSTTYWPVLWPPPESVPVELRADGSVLELPVRPPRPEDAPAAPAPPARRSRTATRDPATGDAVERFAVDVARDGGPALERIPEIDLLTGHSIEEEARIRDDDPLSARADVRHHWVARRAGWSVAIRMRLRLSCTRDAFRLQAELEADAEGAPVTRRSWDRTIPREGSV